MNLKRLENVQNYLRLKEVDILILEDPASLFYFTQFQVPSSAVFCLTQKDYKLFVDNLYFLVAKKKLRTVELLKEESIKDLVIENSKAKEGAIKIAFDSKKTSYLSYQKYLRLTSSVSCELIGLEDPLRDFRMIKDREEVVAMRKAAEINWRGFEHICSNLKEGVSEKELAMDFEFFCRREGAEALSFAPIICFGDSSCIPHHIVTERTLRQGDIVLIDIGVTKDHYCSDMTRCVFFGEPDPDLADLYQAVKRAHAKALSFCRPGMRLGDLEKVAKEVIREAGYEDYLLHSLGHGIGIECHEFPAVKEPEKIFLKPGMVFTIEPGLYWEGLGGVRYEDTILITEEGYENFYVAG